MTDQPATGPRVLHIAWDESAIRTAVKNADAVTDDVDSASCVYGSANAVLTWLDLACLLDMARAWMSAQEAARPTELREVPGISPAEFEDFKTRWREQHGPPSGDDWASAVAYFNDLKFKIADLDQRWCNLPFGHTGPHDPNRGDHTDATDMCGTYIERNHADGRSP